MKTSLRLKYTLAIILVVQFFIYSQDNSEAQVIFYDSCPFECCQFGSWVIHNKINVYASENDTADFVYRLNNNDTIYAETGNLHFLQIGKVLVTKPIYGYQVGDTISAFKCMEGSFQVKYRGVEKEVDIFWPEFMYNEDDTEENYLKKVKEREYSGKMIRRPETVWWVKIESVNGPGWIRLKNQTPYCFSLKERISGMDGCE